MTKLYLINGSSVSFGRSSCNDFCYSSNDLLSSRHILLSYQNGTGFLTMNGKNGGYLDDRYVGKGEKIRLEYGSEIRVPQITILWIPPLIAMITNCEYSTSYLQMELKTLSEYYLQKSEQESFVSSPKGGIYIDRTPIELEAPPRKTEEQRTSTITAILPALSMSLPMLIGILFTSFYKNNHNQSFMYTGVITAVVSGIMGAVLAYQNLKRREELIRENEAKRRSVYERYVDDCENRIRDRFQKNRNALKAMNPEIKEVLCNRYETKELFSYRSDDEEGFNVRFGTGIEKFETDIIVPKSHFEIISDELTDLPLVLKKKYELMKDVPICVNIFEKSPVGIICNDNQSLSEIIRVMILTIASRIHPSELALCFAVTKNQKLFEEFSCIKYLPHFWGSERHFVCSNAKDATEFFTSDFIKYKLVVITDCYTDISNLCTENTSIIVISNDFYNLPYECKSIIQKDSKFCGYLELTKGNIVRKEISFDRMNSLEFLTGVKRISQIVNSIEKENTSIPEYVDFYEMMLNSLNKYEKIDSKAIMHIWSDSSVRDSIKIPIGYENKNTIMYIDLHDLKCGPHGIVCGTTGSGKSEVLQTIILSLSLLYSPEEVGFLIIDYKGGTMGMMFSGLPHLLGNISNLSGAVVRRAMISVKSENQRRQQIFNKYYVNNISDYIELYKGGIADEPLPHIFIVVDEFAELKKEQPEFLRELISVARVGRSLGVHLILATQKAAGTIDENIISNTRFKICLRVQDKQDSNEVLHTYDAADIRNPGRSILQVGNNEIYKFFQSAYTMAQYNGKKRKEFVHLIDEKGNSISAYKEYGDANETVLSKMIDEIKVAYRDCKYPERKRLWQEPLGNMILRPASNDREDILIGIYDDPYNQATDDVKYNLYIDGHLLVIGGICTGKTNTLMLILMHFMSNYTSDELNYYIIDYGSFTLGRFNNSYLCGGYFSEDNEHDIDKLFFMINKELLHRRKVLNGIRYGKDAFKNGIRPLVIFIDGIGSFREKTGGRYDPILADLLKKGENVGIYFIISALNISSNELPSKLFEYIQTVFTLSLNDKYRYQEALRVSSDKIISHENVPGRGLCKIEDRILEYQTYLYYSDENISDDYIEQKILYLNSLSKEKYTLAVPVIPDKPVIEDLKKSIIGSRLYASNNRIPLGYVEESGELYMIETDKIRSVIVSGKSGSGKSNFLMVVKEIASLLGYKSQHENEHAEKLVIERDDHQLTFYVFEETMSMKDTVNIKELCGNNPYIIHFGGSLERQSIADYSYISYTNQIKCKPPGMATVHKRTEDEFYGDVIIPRCI